ncbi:MAG: metal ABC transporter ATP-binding protein [Dialister pneumosintes]
MIIIENLFFKYTGQTPYTLSGVNLLVPKGSYISIVGNNGCGKSTLLKLILGFLSPTTGTIQIKTNKIGYVPQRQEFNSAFPITVQEVIYSYGKLLHMKNINVCEILSITQMQDFKNQLVGDLSGGQYQRMLIARALMGTPDLLVLDEPSTGVDISSQKEIYKILRELNKNKKLTILSVEHNLYAATESSSMIYHLSDGKGHLCTPQNYLKEYIAKEGFPHA